MYHHINQNVCVLPGKMHLVLYSAYTEGKCKFWWFSIKENAVIPCCTSRLHQLQQQFDHDGAVLYFLTVDNFAHGRVTPVLGTMDIKLANGKKSKQRVNIPFPDTIFCSQFRCPAFEFTSPAIKWCSDSSKDIKPTDDGSYYSVLHDAFSRDNKTLPMYEIDRSFEVNCYENFVFILSCKDYSGSYHITILKISNHGLKATFELVGNLVLESELSTCACMHYCWSNNRM